MDVLIAVCAGLILGFLIGYIIAWRKQKKRLEAGFNHWATVKTANEYGKRIAAEVIEAEPIKGNNTIRIIAEYQDPFTNAKYPFEKTFFKKAISPAFIQKLRRLESVSVLVYVDTTSLNYLFWMERPW